MASPGSPPPAGLGRRGSHRGSFTAPMGSAPNLELNLTATLTGSMLAPPGQRRNSFDMRLASARQGGQAAVPPSSYSSACPLEPVCCGLKPANIPACRDSPVMQGLFGNTTDLATRAKETSGDQGGKIMPGQCQLGLRRFAEAGWNKIATPKVLTELESNQEREHYWLALRCLGVFCVRHTEENCERFAIQFNKNEIPGSVAEIKHLFKVLGKIDHVNVPRFIEACEDEQDVTVIYEDCDGAGRLPMQILTEQEPLTRGQSARLCQQIAAATCYCHDLNIYHFDWSIWSIMCTSYQSISPIKVFGFGLAGVLHSGRSSSIPELAFHHCGTYLYRSPELAAFTSMEVTHFTRIETTQKGPTDVYGIGAVLYCCISGHSPYAGSDPVVILKKIQEQSIPTDPSFDTMGSECWALIERMMDRNPKLRLDASSIIVDPWVMVYSKADDPSAVLPSILIDRLRHYTMQRPVMHLIAKLLVQSLRPETLGAIENSFRTLDIKGDGELDYSELMAVASDKRSDIREIFKCIDHNGSNAISVSEYVQANVYDKEVLTERMLLASFNSMDRDGSGMITAFELFKTLRALQPDISPAVIMDFIEDTDKDWDTSITFDEWRERFPGVKTRSKELDRRKGAAEDRHRTCQTIFGQLYTDVKEMLEKLSTQLNLLQKMHDLTNEEHKGGALDDVDKMIKIMKVVSRAVKFPPALRVPPGVSHSKQHKKNPSGWEALPLFYNTHKEKWVKSVTDILIRSEQLKKEQRKERRKDELRFASKEAMPLVEQIIIFYEDQLEEQQNILDAVEHNEEGVPRFPITKRGLPLAADEAGIQAQQAVEEYRATRQKEQKVLGEAGSSISNGKRDSVAGRRASQTGTPSPERSRRSSTSGASPSSPKKRASFTDSLLVALSSPIAGR